MSTQIQDAVAAIVLDHKNEEGALLPILHAVQKQFGHIPRDAVPYIAKALNLSRAEIHGVVSFYDDFRTKPIVGTHIRICAAEACQAMGARALIAHAKNTADKDTTTVEYVYCLGNCARAPNITVDGRLFGDIDCAAFDTLLAKNSV